MSKATGRRAITNRRWGRRAGRILQVIFGLTLVLGNLALVTNVASAGGTNPAATLDQCANGGVDGPYTPCVGSNISAVQVSGTSYKAWQNGDLNGNQAHWAEGEFISYRAILSNLNPGWNSVQIRWDPTDNGKHAIDYLGSYDATEKTTLTTMPTTSLHANNNNPCADLVLAGQLDPSYCNSPPKAAASVPVNLTSSDFGQGGTTMCGLTPGNNYPHNPQAGQIDFFGPVSASIGESPIFTLNAQNQGGTSGPCYSYATITFFDSQTTVTNQPVVMAWGGHIASSLDWGAGNAAGNINGSPYHMAITQLDNATVGHQDRALAASAIIAPTTLTTQVDTASGQLVSPTTVITTGATVYDTSTLAGGGSALPPTGSVTYSLYSGSCATGSQIGSSSTVGLTSTGAVPNSATSPPLGAGSYYYLASYSGDANYSPSTAACEPFTVSKATSSVSTTPYLENGSPVGSSANVPATVYDSASVSGVQGFVPRGQVTFTLYDNAGVDSSGLCTGTAEQTTSVALTNGAAQSGTFGIGVAGNYGFSVNYGGDSNYLPSQGSCELFSFGTSPTLTTTTIYDANTTPPQATSTTTVGATVYDTATVTAGGSPVTTGSVTFDFFANGSCNGTAVSSYSDLPNASGVATSQTTGALPAGTYSYLAVYGGNGTYGASTATCEVLQVQKATLAIVTTVLSASQAVVGHLALGSTTSDSVSSLSGITTYAPSGTATYELFSTGDCSGGFISDTVTLVGGVIPDSSVSSPLGAGNYSYELTYNGDNNYAASSGPCEPFSVNQGTPGVTTTVLDSGGNPVTATLALGSQVSDSATFSNLVTGIAPTGGFTYQLFGSATCTGTPVSTQDLALSGSSGLISNSLLTAPLGAGNYSYLATYQGGANYTSAVAGCEPFSVSTAPATLSTTIYNASTNSPVQNDTVLQGTAVYDTSTLGGTVAGVAPTGTVSYEFFNTLDCSGTSASYGSIAASNGALPNSNPTGALAVGSYSFQATFSGDPNYVVDNTTVPCEPLTVAVLHSAPTLSITKTVSQSQVQLVGTTGTVSDSYTLTPDVVSGWLDAGIPVTVTDSLPTYGGYVYGYQVATSSSFIGSCNISTGNTGPVLSCTYTPPADMQTPSLGTITLDFLIKNDAPTGMFVNMAGVQYGDGSQVPSNSVNVYVSSSAPAPTLLKQVANGEIKPTSTTGTTSDSFTLTPSVSGWVYGPATVTVTDALPGFGGYASYGTPLVTTSQPPVTCAIDISNLLTCTYSLTATSSYSPALGAITVPFSVSNDAPAGTFYNQAQISVTQSGTAGAPENSNVVSVTVTPPPPVLGITKSASSPAAQPGGTDGFLLLPTVSGWVYHTVTISDPLPQPYMTSTGSPVLSGSSLPTGSTFTCSVVSETVTCTFTPPSGGVFSPNLGSVTVPVAFSGSTPAGVYTNTATVSDTGDGSTSMQSSATVTVSTPPAAPSVAPPPTPTSVAVPSTVPTGGHFGTRWFYLLIAVNGIAVLEISRRLLRRKHTA